MADYGFRAVNSNNTSWVNVYAGGFVNNSLATSKTNIQELSNAIDIVNSGTIYSYNYKSDLNKAKYGLVIGDGYNAPENVLDNDGQGVDVYSMTSITWRAVQELYNKITTLEDTIASLQAQN